jgi:hypothetical protein
MVQLYIICTHNEQVTKQLLLFAHCSPLLPQDLAATDQQLWLAGDHSL